MCLIISDLENSHSILINFRFSHFFLFNYLLIKVAGLDLNERKGSTKYIPPHLRGEISDSLSTNSNDTNQGENFRENYNNRSGGERDFNNR